MTHLFVFQAEDGIRHIGVTGIQTCALPIWRRAGGAAFARLRVLGPVHRLRPARRPLPRPGGPARPREGRRGMMSVSRADTSVLGRWWWTVDRWTLAALLALIGFGYVMMLAASPAVAERVIGSASRSLLLAKQVVFLGLAAALMMIVSLLSPRGVPRFALLGCLAALALTSATLVIEIGRAHV